MTKQERTKQLNRRCMIFLIIVNVICWAPFFHKYFGSVLNPVPTAGVSAYLSSLMDEPIEIVKEEEEVVKESVEMDLTCWQKYTAKRFKVLGRVKYGRFTYTWYSEKVLPGGGLKIPGRHVNEDGFVCDQDGYICVASDDLPKGEIVNTPVGIKGKVYDCGSGRGNLDLYVSW